MVKISSYFERLDIVAIQFRFLRFTVAQLPKARRVKFFRELKREETERTKKAFEMMKGFWPGEPAEFEAFKTHQLEWTEKHLLKKFSRRNQRFYDEFIEDGINASELLIRVAHFEAFMKDIHLEVLRAKPALLGEIRPKREVKYEDVFKTGVSYTDFQNQECMREVEEVDRLGISKRAKYFLDNLKLRWCDDTNLELLVDVMDLRNQLSHETPSHPVEKEFLDKAIDLLRSIPSSCIHEAEKLYPGRFK